MTFNDIFKSNFLNNVQAVPLFDIALTLILSFGLGVFIFLIYKKTYKGVMYSSSFATTLIALTMITSMVILAITSNVVLSLGMVGALSIVRFRTAIKEPLDIAFLFWSIASGIILAAGMIPLAVVGSIIIGLILLFFTKIKTSDPYILTLSINNAQIEEEAMNIINKKCAKAKLKSKIVDSVIELQLEVSGIDNELNLLNELREEVGVSYATLVSYKGDFAA